MHWCGPISSLRTQTKIIFRSGHLWLQNGRQSKCLYDGKKVLFWYELNDGVWWWKFWLLALSHSMFRFQKSSCRNHHLDLINEKMLLFFAAKMPICTPRYSLKDRILLFERLISSQNCLHCYTKNFSVLHFWEKKCSNILNPYSILSLSNRLHGILQLYSLFAS